MVAGKMRRIISGDGVDNDFGGWVKNVWRVTHDIPRGYVLTYGDVARLAGDHRAARRVSQALRRAPGRLSLPWHRIVNAQGKLSFPVDGPDYREQKSLLEREGVEFNNGKIDLQRFGYAGTLDHLVWGER